jgi:acyl carrier protein
MTNQQEHFYMPCKFKVVNTEFLNICPGGFVEDMINDQKNQRNTSWSTSAELFNKLKNFSNQVSPQPWAIGNHSTKEIIFLKNYFQESAITIGILYNKSDYHWLLDNMARFHIFLLNTDPLLATKTDQEILNNLSFKEQVWYYAKSFDQLNLIPKESNEELYDVNVWVRDLLDLDKIVLYFLQLGITLNQSTVEYYKPFINLHKERYKNMETFNLVKNILAKQAGIVADTISPASKFKELNLDSLDIVEILMTLETEFKIELEDSEYELLHSVGELADLVTKKLQEK